ncbi:hypothetical protein N9922_05090 [Cyclobacteriaceae bacterium]|nr:hypothetical protein [Cyclobacteriaceae bacterium]MDB4316236.1 hypothetical protein [Cyclobacteriaceae bacterium]MDB4603533.1 hypothetical protein [Cyclobacteriaceae bacterium]
MRKLFISTVLALSTYMIQAQEYGVYSMHFVRIEGNTDDFEKVQSMYMQKVAKQAAEKGDITFWAFLKHVAMDNIDDEERYNYVFVQSNASIEAMLSEKNNWWNHAAGVLNTEEQALVSALSATHTWTADSRHIYLDEGSIAKGLGGFIQFNFARPENVEGFIQENLTLWKPYFEKNMERMGMVNWGVGRKIAPLGANWAKVSTWDMFNTLEELMKYRIGYEMPTDLLKKSKMTDYNPDGFMMMPIFQMMANSSQ